MALLLLRKSELEVLSLVSGKTLNSFSVFNGIEGFTKEVFKSKKQEHIVAINDFIKDGAIWKTPDGNPHLIRELQGVFTVLNTPKKTVCIKAASSTAFVEHYYSSIDDMGVLFSIGKDDRFYTINYPFNMSLLSTWLKDEIIGELGAEEVPRDFEVTLTQEEFNVLSMLIMNSGYSMMEGTPMMVDQMMSQEFLEYVDSKNIFKLNVDGVRKIVESDDFRVILNQLEEKSVIKLSGDVIELHEVLSKGFLKDYLREVVEVKEVSPFNRGKNLYITNLGYLIFEPVLSQPVTWKIRIIGLDAKTLDLLNELVSFSDFTPSAEFRDEMEKRMKIN